MTTRFLLTLTLTVVLAPVAAYSRLCGTGSWAAEYTHTLSCCWSAAYILDGTEDDD